MALYVYNATTGALVSWCPGDSDPVASADELQASGLTVATGLPALDSTHAWDAAQKTVVTVAAPVVPNWIPSWEFAQCFTSVEFATIRASTDPIAQRFMFMLTLAPQVNLNDPLVQNGVGYLAQAGLIQAPRVAQVLAGTVQAT